ncbi:MAG: hypothetical protein HC869_23385, partial [Rhodospirillales bacterium]|nr:hypothetical protein [Rhodospirillales bacterium]
GFEKIFALNVTAVFDLTRALRPLLRRAARPDDPARVVNITSVGGIGLGGPFYGEIDNFSYGAVEAMRLGYDVLAKANPGIIYIPPDIAPAEDFEDQGPDDGTVVQGPTVLALDVAGMDTESKLYVVIEKTIPLLPGEAGDYLRQMLQPEALAIMAGVVVVWALSHFVGIGEIVDVIQRQLNN